MKHILAAGLVCGALALGVVASASAASRSPEMPEAPVLEQGGGQGQAGARSKQRGLLALLVKATADVSGLSAGEIGKELKNGKSLAQIAQNHGKTADAAIQAARTRLKTRLDAAVAKGNLTQTRADRALADFDAGAPAVMQQVHPIRQQRQEQATNQQVRRLRAALIKATADVTGMSVREVANQLKAGQSLAQIARDHGKTAEDILARLRDNASGKIDTLREQARTIIDQPGAATP